MKKIIAGAIILFAAVNTNIACTLCGCSASNQYLGILPQSHNNFIGLQYQNRYFTSADMDGRATDPEAISKQYYNTVQLWGRYSIGSVQLFAFVPYVYNIHKEESGVDKINGLGDITLLANVRILGNKCTGRAWTHQLQAGAGVKLPTGLYKRDEILYDEGLPNMQAGTHSFDFVADANYTLTHNNTGLNFDVSCTLATPNSDHYKFGNRLSAGLLAFYGFKQKRGSLIPQAGFRYDLAGSDYDDYSARIKNDMSGGHQLYASVMLQFFYRKLGFQAGYHQPITQHYADGLVKNKYKTEAGLYFLF